MSLSDIENPTHHFFVSYSYPGGFGQSHVTTTQWFPNMKIMQKDFAKVCKARQDQIIVLNIQRLSTEEANLLFPPTKS